MYEEDFLFREEEVGKICEIEDLQSNAYRPWAEPYLSLLIGAGHELCQRNKYDVIVGWYLEPYGVAAAQLANIYDIPLVLRHAGSDMAVLTKNKALENLYKWSANQAEKIVASESVENIFLEWGVPPERLVRPKARQLDLDFRYRKRRKMGLPTARRSLEEYALGFSDWAVKSGLSSADLESLNLKHRSKVGAKLLMYGKLGVRKGSFQILEALEKVATETSEPFVLYYAFSGLPSQIRKFCQIVGDSKLLRERIVLLPPLAPWNVPDLVNQVDVSLFLESEFPVQIHMPRVPREILASKSHLVCSSEIVQKMPFGRSLIDGKNVTIVEDPANTDQLAKKISFLLENQDAISEMSTRASLFSEFFEDSLQDEDIVCDVVDDIMHV